MANYLILISLLLTSTAFADVPARQVDEVNHLLKFVKNSKCVINRNGTDHPAKKAVNHIESKYDHFRGEIETTEDFITLSATKSTLSGKYYTVLCPGEKVINTRDWLLAELKHIRNPLTVCSENLPQICTQEYVPVCAKLRDGGVKTYSTGCTACSDINVVDYKPGICR